MSQTISAVPIYVRESRMNNEQDGAKWVHCPICGSKTRTKVHKDTVVQNFPLYCTKCKTEVRVDISQLKMTVSK